MSEILLMYRRVEPTSWAYLSSLLTIALYFKFSRFWSVRNLDLIGLILIAPGLLLVKYGLDHGVTDSRAAIFEHVGYIWLFSINGLFLLRLLLDTSMVRRPLLEPNLSVGGLTFLGLALCVFLTANVITGSPEEADLSGSQLAANMRDLVASKAESDTLQTYGPSFPLFYFVPYISTQTVLGDEAQSVTQVPTEPGKPVRLVHVVTARVMAILSQLALIIGMTLVGLRHFDNVKMGIAAATLYLLLPYTAMWTGSTVHALPGALLVWAIVMYRRPLWSGCMIGLAIGTIYYPVFLLPLWISFYWQKGRWRFLTGMLVMVLLSVLSLAFTSIDVTQFLSQLQMFSIQFPVGENMSGVWKFWNEFYRYPIMAAFIGLSLSFALWPAQKNLGTLISCSAAVMLGTQFWHAHSGGGLALAWFLPLLLLTIFRPNLEDRVATAVVR